MSISHLPNAVVISALISKHVPILLTPFFIFFILIIYLVHLIPTIHSPLFFRPSIYSPPLAAICLFPGNRPLEKIGQSTLHASYVLALANPTNTYTNAHAHSYHSRLHHPSCNGRDLTSAGTRAAIVVLLRSHLRTVLIRGKGKWRKVDI